MLNLSRPISICDIGAALQGEQSSWHSMVGAGFATVIGFEPEEEAFKALQALGDGYEVLPYVIADGKPGTFHLNQFSETSSLLPTNREFVKRYQGLPDLMTTKDRSSCETKTLDDALDGRAIDLLKIDVQGMTLPLLQNAQKTLATYPLVECEVEFQQLYEGQALFAEVDIYMREQGYMLLKLREPRSVYFEPLPIMSTTNTRLGQTGWTDAIYVPNHDIIDELSEEALERLATLCLLWYGHLDFATSLLQRMDRRFGSERLHQFGLAMKSGAPFSLTVGDIKLTLPNIWNSFTEDPVEHTT